MSCCGGCPDRPDFEFTKCVDCGAYGSICCMKLTGNGETWFLRSEVSPPAEFGARVSGNFNHHFEANDACEESSGVQCNGTSNLCGGLSSVQPCSMCGARAIERTNGPGMLADCDYRFPDGTRNYRQTVCWSVKEDCSAVVFTLYYRDGSFDAGGIPNVTRYTAERPTSWIGSGLPITWETEFGTLTLSECQYYEPPPPTVLICCWQAAFTGLATVTKVSRRDADIPACLLKHPRWDNDPATDHIPTDQCSLGSIRINRTPDGAGETSINEAFLFYEVSPDYQTVNIHVLAALLTTVGMTPTVDDYAAWDATTTVPYTTDWFLTPIAFTNTSGRGAGATLTISVCGYEVVDPDDRPCLEQPIYVTFEGETREMNFVEGGRIEVINSGSGSGFQRLVIRLTQLTEPEPPWDTVRWTIRVQVYEGESLTLACDAESEVPSYCDEDGNLQMYGEVTVCGIDFIFHAGA